MRSRRAAAALAFLAMLSACREEGRPEAKFPALPADPPAVEGVVYGVGRPDDYYDERPPYGFRPIGRVRRVELPGGELTTFDTDGDAVAVSNGRLLATCCVESGGASFARVVDGPTITDLPLPRAHSGSAEIAGGRLALIEPDRTNERAHTFRIRDHEGREVASVNTKNGPRTSLAALPDGGFGVVVNGPEGGDFADNAILMTFSAAGVPLHEAPLGDIGRVDSLGLRWRLAVSPTWLAAVTGDNIHLSATKLGVAINNAFTGDLLRNIEGWTGAAWSADGTGLLVARAKSRAAPRSTELGLLYGPKLAKFKTVGVVDGEFVPMRWVPEALPGA